MNPRHDFKLLLVLVGVSAIICVGMLRAIFEVALEERVQTERQMRELDAAITRLHRDVIATQIDVDTTKKAVLMDLNRR